MKKNRDLFWKCILVCLVALAAFSCGDDDNSSEVSKTIEGVAATGAAMASAQVRIVDSQGTVVTTTTDSQGRYTITKEGLTPPFAVEVTNAQSDTFHALSFSYGRINITPLTEIITAMAMLGGDPTTVMDNLSTITEQSFTTAKTQLKNKLAPLLEAFGASEMDLISSAFEANSQGIDALLDLISTDFQPSSGELTISTSSGQTLFQATLSNSGMTTTTPLTTAALLTTPALSTKLFGEYHVVDFNTDTTEELSEIRWGDALFTADGFANLNILTANGGETGSETVDYTLSPTGLLDMGGNSGVQGSSTTNKDFLVLSDIYPNDGDTGMVFFIRKAEEAPVLSGQYKRLEFTRNNTGNYETDSWSTDFTFTWDQTNQTASFDDDGQTQTLQYSQYKRFEGPNGLILYPAMNGALLIIPHAAPDDSGFTIMIKSPLSPYIDFDDTNDSALENFLFTGFDIDTADESFTAERGDLVWAKTNSSTGTFTLSGEAASDLQCDDGIFRFSNSGNPDLGSFGLYPNDGVIVWVDRKESGADTEFGVHFAIKNWPQD